MSESIRQQLKSFEDERIARELWLPQVCTRCSGPCHFRRYENAYAWPIAALQYGQVNFEIVDGSIDGIVEEEQTSEDLSILKESKHVLKDK